MMRVAFASPLFASVLCAAVAPLHAESVALTGPAEFDNTPVSEQSAGWRGELRRWILGPQTQSGELMAVVLPEVPEVVPPVPPVVPPVVPPPRGGIGRIDGDEDIGQITQPPEVPPIPEPSSMALLAVGASALAAARAFRGRRRK